MHDNINFHNFQSGHSGIFYSGNIIRTVNFSWRLSFAIMAGEVIVDALPYIDQGYDDTGVREAVYSLFI